MRLDKFICDTINITRNQAKTKISSGVVLVDGVVVKSSSYKVDESKSVVTVEGQVLQYNKYVYIMMNKPHGVLSAAKDSKCKTAIDLLSEEDKRHDLFIAGRLDKDTTGFLLITNDGDFAHSILSPKKHIFKTYFVTLQHNDVEGYEKLFSDGIILDDGYKCKTAEFEYIEGNHCKLKISEGKFHQIKRMFHSLGNEVVALSRIAMGDLFLDEGLKEGEYKYLTDKEVQKIMCNFTKKTSSNFG